MAKVGPGHHVVPDPRDLEMVDGNQLRLQPVDKRALLVRFRRSTDEISGEGQEVRGRMVSWIRINGGQGAKR